MHFKTRALPGVPLDPQILLVFTALSKEMEELARKARQDFLPPLSLFGLASDGSDREWSDGVLTSFMGRTVPMLQDLRNFILRSEEITCNLVHQLASLYNKDSPLYGAWKDVRLSRVFRCAADLFHALIAIDCVIE